ncbi:MAG: class I SAM-dependent methyltransferase [Bacilli bacterium]
MSKAYEVKYDEWLVDFDDIVNSVNGVIIDLGCGAGNNTLYLKEKNKNVISCDYSQQALDIVEKYILGSQTMLFDMTDRLPFEDNYTELVIADLCLHHFSEEVTLKVINEIKRILKKDGHLMFRVNSVNDTNYGAMQGEKLEKTFYFVNDITKRFFDEEDLRKFFKDWNIEYMNEEIMGRYDKIKKLWRCVVRK